MDTSTSSASASASASTSTSTSTSIDMAAEFRAGVTAVLRTWSALRAAVVQGWGGVESHDKAEDLRRNVLENFDLDGTGRRKPMDRHDLEDELVAYMEEELSVVLEDDSERQVAGVICDMYGRCRAGDAGLAREMVSVAERQRVALASAESQGHRVVVQSLDDDDDDDIMEEGDGDGDGGGNNVTAGGNNVAAGGDGCMSVSVEEYASGPLFPGGRPSRGAAVAADPNLPPPRQLGEPEQERPAMEVDEDGFAPVQPRRSKRLANKQVPSQSC